jgi:Tfp pilus assembly protein PilF
MNMTANLEAMLARGQDNPALRLALATRYFDQGDMTRACQHAAAATEQDADYSAAWKLLGRAQAAAGQTEAAAATFRQGMAVASRRGDQQAAREMQVFLKRLEKSGS